MNGVPFQFTCDKCGDYLIATSRLYVCERCAVDTVEGSLCPRQSLRGPIKQRVALPIGLQMYAAMAKVFTKRHKKCKEKK